MQDARNSHSWHPHGLAFLALLVVAAPGWSKVVHVNKNTTGTVHNGASWGTAFITVQAGINAAAPADEIWVAASAPAATAYVENVTLKAGTALYGGFAGTETVRDRRTFGANPTTLKAPSTGGSVVYVPTGCGPDTVLDGFTITGGAGTNLSAYPDPPWRSGGGVFCRDASPTISHNTITGNFAMGDLLRSGGGSGPYYAATGGGEGAGIYCRNSNAAIVNNTISANGAWNGGGGIFCSGGAPTVTGNVFDHNTATYPSFAAIGGPPASDGRGGGVVCDGSSAAINGNSFLRNDALIAGGGLYVDGGSVLATGNTFSGNDSTEGGGAACYSGILSGNTISSNSAQIGGGIWAVGVSAVTNCNITGNSSEGVYAGDTASVTNCTITANTVGIGGKAGSTPAFTNCIVAYNGTGIRGNPSGNAFKLSHNDVYGNTFVNYASITDPTGMNGNISQDPVLSNHYLDMHLQPGSPCIDAGDDAVVTPGETDAYGKPRVIGSHVDIGADESDGTTWSVTTRIWYVASTGTDGNDGASWGTSKKTITAALSGAGGSDEVWVAKGTYTENLTMPLGVTLYGGFAGTERSRGQRVWRANPTVLASVSDSEVVACRGGNVVDGFTILGYDGIAMSGGPTTIANCTMPGTGSGYAIYVSAAAAIITGCTITGGKNGSGVEMVGGTAAITDSTFSGLGHGLALDSTATVTNCTISGCDTGMIVNGNVRISNSIIAFNSAGIREGNYFLSLTLSHNDAYGNTMYNYGGVIDPTGANGNISADPLFANRTTGDYHVLAASPCINAGDDSVVHSGDTDLDGKPRIIGAHVDMGAYEFGTGFYNIADAAKALRLAAGLDAAPSDISRWNVVASSPGVDLLDAVRIARMAAGFDPNP